MCVILAFISIWSIIIKKYENYLSIIQSSQKNHLNYQKHIFNSSHIALTIQNIKILIRKDSTLFLNIPYAEYGFAQSFNHGIKRKLIVR